MSDREKLKLPPKPKGYITTSTLIIFAFGTVFFSRSLDSLGAPSTINFLHFATIPFACVVALTQTRTKNRHQIFVTWALLAGLWALLSVMLASTIINEAGIINLVFSFLLLGEPFLMVLALVCVPLCERSLHKFRVWLIRFGFANLIVAYGQFVLFVILGRHPKPGNPDYIQGVFYHSGAGHVVSASVSMTFGLYYLVSAKTVPLWIRVGAALATFYHMLMADAKQVLLAFLGGGILLLVTKLKSVGEAIKYITGAIVFGGIFYWCMQNVEAFSAFNTWARPEIYGPEGEATLLKTAAIRLIPTHYNSWLNALFGLGPGHTVSRLGGWMLNAYWNLLSPLGATRHVVSGQVWGAVGASWLGNQSSMFSPLFGWAGIWGDFGWLGLLAYLYLSWVVWQYICLDDLSRFLLLSVLVFGLIFSQMEEPGYMLFVAIVVALRWQEQQNIKARRERDAKQARLQLLQEYRESLQQSR
ncbi:MAG: hypothetical protein J7641_14035 [Cyanobacteria bacterium SID2]|nr:hypothetical protein [Cyanobacteria bacterium SID2]MBP0005158.1 hypothetical protein [Cyanobacteria bacterium SBC]